MSIFNFINEYTQVADNWFLYDNCSVESKLIADKLGNRSINISDENLWLNINEDLK